ncbi:hypothetical protein J6590_005267 [Homalodisca vitripennis]|nr:hypothetical protein J6590_005267 [Homalodisca vitripennis]
MLLLVFLGAVESFLIVFGMTIGCTCYIPSSVKITRQIISFWSLLSFFVSAIFSNTILSRLMVPYHTSPLDSVKDLVKSNFQWGEPGFENISEREVYFNLEDPWQKKFESRYQELTRNTSRTALLSGKFAFPVTRLGHDYVFVNIVGVNQTKDFRGFRVMKQPLNEFYVSLVFSKHSPILEICREKLQRFFQVGLVNYWKKDVILRHGNADIEQLLYDSSTETVVNSFEPLTLSNNLAAFRILLSGLSLAVLVFAFELLSSPQT